MILSGEILLQIALGRIAVLARMPLTKRGVVRLRLELDRDRAGIGRFDAVDVVPHRAEGQGRLLAEVEGEGDVLRRQLAAVGPLGAVLQRQHERVVVRLLQFLGQAGGERAVQHVEPDQALIDQLRLVARRVGREGRRGAVRVEAGRRAPLEARDEQGFAGGAGTATAATAAAATVAGLGRAAAGGRGADDGTADGQAGDRQEPTTVRGPAGHRGTDLRGEALVILLIVHCFLPWNA